MMNRRELICLIVFTLVCVGTTIFIHTFTRYSSDEFLHGRDAAVYDEVNGTVTFDKTELKTMSRNITGFANHYAIPAGICSFIFVILSGLFFFNILAESPDYTLIVPAIASLGFAVNSISTAQGFLFLPERISSILSAKYTLAFIIILIIIYIALNVKKTFIRYFIFINLTAFAVFAVYYLVCVARGIYVPEWMRSIISGLPGSLLYGNFTYYFSLYLLFVSFLSTYVYNMGKYARLMATTEVLSLQNRLVTKNYESILQNIQQTSAMRHEWKNNIIAMELMYRQGKTAELGEYIEKLNNSLSELQSSSYAENFTINAIVQRSAEKAKAQNITFRTNIYVPNDLKIADSDLCSLIINMLDNSVEACSHMPKGKKRFIEFNARLTKGYLNISCKNSYSGNVRVSDPDNSIFETTKINKADHGFGIKQMNIIAKKYDSLIDINYGNGVFRVQTSLKNLPPPINIKK